jgi:signal transduction histidine kinase
MRRKAFFIILGLTFIIEIVFILCILNTNYKNDTIKINELVNEIRINFGNESKYPKGINYTIIDNNDNFIYSNNNQSKSLNDAYKNQDTIVDTIIDGNTYKILIKNNIDEYIKSRNITIIVFVSIVSFIQLMTIVIYYLYLNKKIIKPFKQMENFASRVAEGNLDIPLTMDKNNNFGAFTEGFDIMREELKKAKMKEKEANDSKKELIAKLSHDIKTPVASIKSTSELGIVVTKEEKIKNYFETINAKTDQINTLVTNLLSSTIEDLTEININPIKCDSQILYELIKTSDYQNKVNDFNIVESFIYADVIRLQQVIDNIFSNSYKYANTNIDIYTKIEDDYLVLEIKDYGDSIDDLDIPLIVEKYKRGKNAINKDGVGLGLYISKQFIEAMNGILEIKNDKPGFRVIIKLRII